MNRKNIITKKVIFIDLFYETKGLRMKGEGLRGQGQLHVWAWLRGMQC